MARWYLQDTINCTFKARWKHEIALIVSSDNFGEIEENKRETIVGTEGAPRSSSRRKFGV